MRILNIGLHTKLLAAVAVVVIVIMIGATYLSMYWHSNISVREKNQELENRARSLALVLNAQIYGLKDPARRQELERLITLNAYWADVRKITLHAFVREGRQEKCIVVASTVKGEAGKPSSLSREESVAVKDAVDTAYELERGDELIWRVVMPLHEGGEVAGCVSVETALLQADVLASLLQSSAIMVFATPLMIMSLGFLIRRMITNRVRQLSALTEAVAAGDLDHRAPVHADDEIGRLSKSFNDMVASLKESRHQIEELNKRLEEKLDERTRELRAANEQLVESWKQRVQAEKMASLGQMAAGAAHDIRNPLNTIALTASHLTDEFLPSNAEHRRRFEEYTESIKREVGRLDTMVKRLLDFSKPDSHALKKTDMKELIEEALKSASSEPSCGLCKVIRDYDDTLPPLYVDRERLRDAFLNLISNAYQAMPDGGTLTISTSFHPATPGLKAVHDRVKFEFTDTGCGIPEDSLEKLFKTYFTSKDKGIGLGLAIVQRTIEDHKGTVKVKSERGHGSTFTVELPAIPGGHMRA